MASRNKCKLNLFVFADEYWWLCPWHLVRITFFWKNIWLILLPDQITCLASKSFVNFLQRRAVTMIVMVMTDQDKVDGRQLFDWNRRLYCSFLPHKRNNTIFKDGIYQDMNICVNRKNHTSMAEPGRFDWFRIWDDMNLILFLKHIWIFSCPWKPSLFQLERCCKFYLCHCRSVNGRFDNRIKPQIKSSIFVDCLFLVVQ